MAILGFLVHTLPGESEKVEKTVSAMPEVTTYGVHQECYVVAVADTPAGNLEALLGQVNAIDGVLTCYVTSVHSEEELEGDAE